MVWRGGCAPRSLRRQRKAGMERINIGIIGTGWCGGIRAETCADSATGRGWSRRSRARKVMEVYIAADLSAERHEPVSLPLNATPMTTRSGAPE
jgi:hypothetical protein